MDPGGPQDVFSARRHGATVVTALTAQNTRGVRSFQVVEAGFVVHQIDAIYDDVRIDAVKIGMVATAEIAAVIAQRLADHRARNVVLDPVMVAKSGDRLLAEDAVVALRDRVRLVPIAELITPNLPASLGQDASRFCTPARACCRASSAGRVGAWGSFDHFVGAGEQRGGTVRPNALAAFKLITSSYFVGACTGRSAGLSPLKTRST